MRRIQSGSANGSALTSLVGGEDLRLLPLDRLTPHETLLHPVHNSDGVLLLAEGSVLSPRTIDALRQRGIQAVLVHREETAARLLMEARGCAVEVPAPRPGVKINLHTRTSRRLDRELLTRIGQALQRNEPPLLQEVRPHGAEPYEESLSRELRRTHEGFVGGLQMLVRGVLAKAGTETETAADRIVADYLKILLEDIDLFACFAAAPDATHYPQRHGLHVAMLSLAMGARMGLGREDLRTLALGAMLADIGMMRVPKSILKQRTPLTVTQRFDIMQHPIYTVEMLERVAWVPEDVRYVCYQTHERAGAQGYPRRVPKDLIHPLARVVGIADMYVALVSERPYRPAILPYKAMETVLRQVQGGWFDPATARLLLETLSLYPVGSYVLLNDGRCAKVVRSGGANYHRPILRVWPKRSRPSDLSGDLVDLRHEESLEVIEALPAPPL